MEEFDQRRNPEEHGKDRGTPGGLSGGRTARTADAGEQLQREITARKRAEAEAERLRAELAHIERLQTMGEMAGGLAHELSQPLAAIVMRAEAAARKLRLGREESRQQRIAELAEIADEAYRAGQIIRRMRDFVNKVEPHRSTVDLAEVVDEVAALVRSDLRQAGIRFTSHVAPSLPPIQADRVQLQQVLLNLMRNGVEAMDQTAPDAKALSIRAKARDHALEIAVSDAGCGVPEDELDHLFASFRSTKPDGMGIGLAISRSIVEAHGGRIWARQNADRGTTFLFTLPIADEGQRDGS